MRITVVGILIVVAGILLLGLVVLAAGGGTSKTGKADEEPINPS